MKVIILAGGSGTRLWPLSRERYPKQFIKIGEDNESLFQKTIRRSLKIASLDNIYVVTNIDYKFLVMGAVEELGFQFNENNILVEPEGKNTLPAIYLGVHEIAKKGHDLVAVFPSDHIIHDNEIFVNSLVESQELARLSLVTFGIRPDSPHTGYGYIRPGDVALNGFEVIEFKEKPSCELAKEYLEKGYLWNSGFFLFNTEVFIEEVKIYASDIYKAFKESENGREAFDKISRKLSIDYGIMEKSDKVSVVPLEINWNDLGSFDSFYDVLPKDNNGNILTSDTITINSENNLIYSNEDRIVATVGINDIIVVDNKDALLICKREESQNVKKVVEELKGRNDLRLKYHVNDYRPWGHYKVIDEEKNEFKIKRITVNQGKKISYQLHHHRSEHWIVVRGIAKVTINGMESFVNAGESIFMKAGVKHRLENPGKLPLEIIEVQMGDYLEEDDIVRFDDEYGRG